MDASMRLSILKKRILFISEAQRKNEKKPIPKNSGSEILSTQALGGRTLFPSDDINRTLYPTIFAGKY